MYKVFGHGGLCWKSADNGEDDSIKYEGIY